MRYSRCRWIDVFLWGNGQCGIPNAVERQVYTSKAGCETIGTRGDGQEGPNCMLYNLLDLLDNERWAPGERTTASDGRYGAQVIRGLLSMSRRNPAAEIAMLLPVRNVRRRLGWPDGL